MDCFLTRGIAWRARSTYHLRLMCTLRPFPVRPYSVPERLGGFGLLVGAAAVVWPAVTGYTGVGVPCPLRALTGVPCPFCGLTTAAVALVRGQVSVAFAASPLIFGLAALAVVVGPLVGLRAVGVLKPPRPWSSTRRRRTEWAAGVVAAGSWLFQWHRLGVGRPF
jgi:Protein of unknown function (DUF2752)